MKETTNIETSQRKHYDHIIDRYEAHYGDEFSLKYRMKFLEGPLIKKIKLKNKKVLEAMSGSGLSTIFLLNKKAKVTGLDISEKSIMSYKKKWPNCNTICESILNSHIKNNSYDVVVVVGGLHHIHPNVQKAISEIHRILKQKGYFCFMEPHNKSFIDVFRKIWYFFDTLFEKNEAAIDLEKIKRMNKSKFIFKKTEYYGNLGYFLVLNSLVFRIPLRLKKYYSPFLIAFDQFMKPFMTKYTSAYVICQWQKK